MKKSTMLVLAIAVIFVAAGISPAFAGGVGSLRISPSLPIEVSSPAEFETWVQPGCDSVNDLHIFLVMTQACYNSLTGDVEVEWNGGSITIAMGDWTMESDNSVKVPPNTVNGAGYTVASLKDHLETSGPIYWAFEPFLGGTLDEDHQTFTVTLPSGNPEMLVYDLGKCDGSTMFDVRVPPTIPGFVVPEPAAIAAVLSPMIALAGYAIHRKKR
jgi:hypothetical protein